MQVEKRNLETVNTNLIVQSQNNNSVIERLNADNVDKTKQTEILRESLHRAEAIIKRFQLDVDKATGANLGLEHTISDLQRKNRHLEQANGALIKFKRENEDLILQNERLQQKLIDSKMRMDGLRFDQKQKEGLHENKAAKNNYQLKEAD